MTDGQAASDPDPEDHVLQETEQGVFGIADVIADFDPAQLDTLRRVAGFIRTTDRPGVQAAIALAGSAAQSRFQLFPGDCDFFERVHIEAPTRDEAIATLAALMVETVARTFTAPDLQFSEMKLGLYRETYRRGAEVCDAGSPISWGLAELDARSITVERPDGTAEVLELVGGAAEPGFVKIDWILADEAQERVVPVSKVIDATWGAPDGRIVALDGVLDSFYQEVYLDPETKPHVERLIEQVAPDGLEDYIDQLNREVRKYTEPGHENYGKVAKRLYNIFRVTKRHELAARLRTLFDDPPARLYQVTATLHVLTTALGTRRLSEDVSRAQVSELADTFEQYYTGDDRDELVALVRSLPDLDDDDRKAAAARITERANEQVSARFEAELTEDPEIAGIIAGIREAAPET
jgi:hypothetical protein